MSGALSNGIPVCNADGEIIQRVFDLARARRLCSAPNAKVVRKRGKRGQSREIVRILLLEDQLGVEWLENSRTGNPMKYSYLLRTPKVPQGVHSLKHIPDECGDIFDAVLSSLMPEKGAEDSPHVANLKAIRAAGNRRRQSAALPAA